MGHSSAHVCSCLLGRRDEAGPTEAGRITGFRERVAEARTNQQRRGGNGMTKSATSGATWSWYRFDALDCILIGPVDGAVLLTGSLVLDVIRSRYLCSRERYLRTTATATTLLLFGSSTTMVGGCACWFLLSSQQRGSEETPVRLHSPRSSAAGMARIDK